MIALVIALAIACLRSIAPVETNGVGLIPPVAMTRCTEDMVCWNCETMGNKICGKGN